MKKSKHTIQMEVLVKEIIAEDLDSTRDMFVDTLHPAVEVTPYLVDMALSHHSDFGLIYGIWEEEVYFQAYPAIPQRTVVLKGTNESQWSMLQARVQGELLVYDDGEYTHKEYRVDIGPNPASTALAVDCILKVLAGEPSTAITRYKSACQTLDPELEHKVFPGLSAFFYALAILKKGTQANSVVELGLFLSRYQTAFPEDQIVPWLETLHGFASVSNNKSSVDQLGWLVDNYRSASPWVVLLRCVCLHWLRLKPSAAMIASLEKHLKKAFNAGAMWYVSHARYIILKYGEQYLDDDIDFEESWLCDYITPAQNWQVQLRRIEAIAGSSKPGMPGDATTDEHRLIWCVTFASDTLTLEPRLQKLAKNGRWSKGRKLSLADLKDQNSAASHWITSPAAELIKSLIHDAYEKYSYLESRTPIRVAKPELFELLAKVTDLYRSDEHDPTKLLAMKVNVLKPSLEIIEEPGADATTIRLVPYFGSDRIRMRPWITEWVSQTSLQITVYSKEHLDLASALGRGGLQIPAEGRGRVLASLQNLVPMINVVTDVGTEGLPDIKEVQSDCIPHIELSPTQNGLLAAIKYYPVGSTGLSVVPGEGHTV